MTHEANPQELDEKRLQRDIEAMVKRDCKGEQSYDNFPKQKPRKSRIKLVPKPDRVGQAEGQAGNS